MKQQEKKLKALYYPYSRCQSEIDLKRALLVFDEIFFVDPISQDLAYDNPSTVIFQQDPQHLWYRTFSLPLKDSAFEWPAFDKLRSDYAYLQDKKVVQVFDPKHLIKKNSDLLYASYGFSQQQKNFINYYDYMNDPEIMLWIMPKTRIPNLESVSSAIKKSINIITYNTITLKHRGQAVKDLPDELVALHADQALPLLLDQALLICDIEGLIPFTDDPKAHSYLVDRYTALTASKNNLEVPIIEERNMLDFYRFEYLALNIIGRTIPDMALKERTFQDICHYRIESKESLTRFRNKIWQLAFDLEGKSLNKEFGEGIKRIIEKEVLPEINKLEDESRNIFEKMFGDIAGKLGQAAFKSAAASAPTLTIASIAGLSPEMIVTMGATSFLSSLGIFLPSIISYAKSKKDLRRNFVHFLWNFNRRARITNALT